MQTRVTIETFETTPTLWPAPIGEPGTDPQTQQDGKPTEVAELFIRKTFEECAEKGFELLFSRYYGIMCSHAVRYVYSREIAEDLVSDVFCKFWKSRSFESVTSSYRFYLFRCVRNEAFNYLRLEFKKLEGIEMAESRETANGQRPDHMMQFEEVFTRVELLVESLPPQCRKVFLMNRFEGYKYKDIADELGISVKTVEAHISKALGTVRQGLKDYWLVGAVLLPLMNL